MSKYTAEQVEAMAEQLTIVNLASTEHKASAMLRDYAALLREREEIAYEGKQQWDEVARTLGADGDNVDAVFAAAKQVVREREAAKAKPVAWRWKEYASPDMKWRYAEQAPNAEDLRHNYVEPLYVAPMLASARVPDGWQLVPVEQTGKMVKAAQDAVFKAYGQHIVCTPEICWNAMLAAAPKPEREG